MVAEKQSKFKWGMAVDIDKCNGCQACVIACQSENNIPINTEDNFKDARGIEWIRVERYWEGEFPNVKAKFIPILCMHCYNAPCEPVCPVYASYHTVEGLNVQIYNRCVGTRYCANGCPYLVRFFNYWEPEWPESFQNHLNPDVTVRSRGIMEKCSMCIQRIRRGTRNAKKDKRDVVDGDISPACVQACPTDALVFGNQKDPESRINKMKNDKRSYTLLDHLKTNSNVWYLAKVDPDIEAHHGEGSHKEDSH